MQLVHLTSSGNLNSLPSKPGVRPQGNLPSIFEPESSLGRSTLKSRSSSDPALSLTVQLADLCAFKVFH